MFLKQLQQPSNDHQMSLVLLAMRAVPAKMMNEKIRNRNKSEEVFEFDKEELRRAF
jgi:hypothetical protein